MATIEYSLFRIKFVKPNQSSVFFNDLTPSQFLLKSLEEKPSSELKQGYKWHIGNLQYYNKEKGYFAIGRTTISTIEKYDNSTRNFIEEEQEESPYTHCVFDAKLGIIGIAKKINLSPTTNSIANRLEEILSATHTIIDNYISVEVRPIPDPDDFIKTLNEAYCIYKFSATFRGPNPFDADAFFQKPLSVYLSSANGSNGTTTISGEDLNKDVLTEVTRSTAATGNEAWARIKKTKKQKAERINLKGDSVKLIYNEENHDPEVVLADLTNQYNRIRHSEGIQSQFD